MAATHTLQSLAGKLTMKDGRQFHQRFEVGNGHMLYSLIPVDGSGSRAIVEGPSTTSVADLMRQVSEQLNGTGVAHQ